MTVKYSRFRHNAKQTSFTSPTAPRRQGVEHEHAQYPTNDDVTSGWSCRRPENVSILSSLLTCRQRPHNSPWCKHYFWWRTDPHPWKYGRFNMVKTHTHWPSEPALAKQRYGTELRSKTLASLKPEIFLALDSLLKEIHSTADTKVLRTTASRFRQPQARPSHKSSPQPWVPTKRL